MPHLAFSTWLTIGASLLLFLALIYFKLRIRLSKAPSPETRLVLAEARIQTISRELDHGRSRLSADEYHRLIAEQSSLLRELPALQLAKMRHAERRRKKLGLPPVQSISEGETSS